MSHPTIVGVGGFSSDVGKTTLVCQLLTALPGWEAIKTTRGHYRSCGKNPQACCVSHLLADEPVIRSGYQQTYLHGKDTGRYWDAGAVDVHWVIVTNEQVDRGIKEALRRVRSHGVFIEGNSFVQFVHVDFMIMVARVDDLKAKASAKRGLAHTSAIYLSGDMAGNSKAKQFFAEWCVRAGMETLIDRPLYTKETLPELITALRRLNGVQPDRRHRH